VTHYFSTTFKTHSACTNTLYTGRVRKKVTVWHNFDKFKQSVVIFGTNHPDTLVYKNIRKFNPTLKHRYVEMTPCLTSSKMPFTDKDGHLRKAFQKENTTLQVNN